MVPSFAPNLIGAAGTGINIAEARVSSPTLEANFMPDLAPLGVGAAEPPADRAIMNWFGPGGMKLTPGEAMNFYVDNATNAEPQLGIVFLSDGIDAMPSGEIQTVRATGATTVGAAAWSACALTFTQTLRAGRYAIVGLRAEGATMCVARLIIPGSAFRPGVMGTDGAGDIVDAKFRRGGLGVWGEFDSSAPPQLEVFCTAADTAQTAYLDVIGPL